MKKMAFLFSISMLISLAACSTGEATTATPQPLEVTLIATDIAYNQSQIEAVIGQPIKLTLDNQGKLDHDFSILEIPLSGEVIMTESAGEMAGHNMGHMETQPDVHIAAAAAATSSVEFTPAEAGEYAFFCTVAGHKEAGMIGTLIVQ